ncbi:MAG: EAL domain-containing protein [Proteobacteria bacterium]|nr:EAL domain-containing protein [Pseudomonadota bacterium]
MVKVAPEQEIFMDFRDIEVLPVLVIAADADFAKTIQKRLGTLDVFKKREVVCVADTAKSIKACLKLDSRYGLIFIDTRLSSIDPGELYKLADGQENGPIVVFVEDNDPHMEPLRDLGAPYFLQKELATPLALKDALRGSAQHFGLRSALKKSEHRFRAMADHLSDALVFIAPTAEKQKPADYAITFYNPSAADLFFTGKPLGNLQGCRAGDYLTAVDWETVEHLIAKVQRTGTSAETEVSTPIDNVTRWFRIQAVPSGNDIAVFFRDISQRKSYEERLNFSEKRFRDIADSFSDWLWEIDTEGMITFASRGRSKVGKGIRKGAHFSTCFLPEDRKKVREDLVEMFKIHEPFYDREYWGLDTEGMRVCWEVSGVPMFDADGTFIGYRGISKDVSIERASQDQLFYLANNDTLTGLFNRGRFYDELKRQIRTMRRYNRQGALMLMDLDRFKYVNDTFGHEAGDSLLINVAHVLRDAVRSSDIVARLGGDEFAVILPEVDPNEVISRTSQLLDKMKNAGFNYEGHDLSVGASIGVVMFPAQGNAAGELLSKADIAMYRAKQEGRNRMHVYDESAVRDHSMAQRIEVVDFILKCLDEDRVELHYQPIIPLQTGDRTVKHYEVLCRMIDDEGKIVPPIKFIETAEDFGLISRIDEYVCTKALARLKDARDEGRDISFAINLSGITFDDEEVLKRIGQILEESNIPPGKVIFEITETAALRDIGRAQRSIRELKRYGCEFALDDFGVGYSSFNYIKHLDIDYLKIDGSFVRNLLESEDDRVFVKALADVARGMSIKTIAEMVEDENVVQYLYELGIDYGQGYHFGRPKPKLLDEE